MNALLAYILLIMAVSLGLAMASTNAKMPDGFSLLLVIGCFTQIPLTIAAGKSRAKANGRFVIYTVLPGQSAFEGQQQREDDGSVTLEIVRGPEPNGPGGMGIGILYPTWIARS